MGSIAHPVSVKKKLKDKGSRRSQAEDVYGGAGIPWTWTNASGSSSTPWRACRVPVGGAPRSSL
ncbi:MAG: hypothetical protein WKF75_07125 [Singulisphaera sp.]